MKLQDKIPYCRKRAGLSQEALAEKIGVSRQAVSKWETGDATPELSKLPLLADAFGVSADWLLSDEDPEREGKADNPEHPSNAAWVDSVPGQIGKLLRRFGWLFGVYMSIAGAGVAFMGGLARTMVRNMFSGFTPSFGTEPVDSTLSSIATNNPVYAMGTAMLLVGIVLVIAGIILALYLKKRGNKK